MYLASPGESSKVEDRDLVYHLRDLREPLVGAWEEAFAAYPDNFKISKGDIFRDAPAADAIVSPANSFGFMDGGIDYVYTKHFGKQMQNRLQEVLQTEYDGEVLVGQAVIIPAYENEEKRKEEDLYEFNQGQPLKFLISAPTMRVPANVSETPNSYLAFRAVILAVRKHNANPDNEPIRSVLVPGLGTSVGRMPPSRCAYQMLQAYETFVTGDKQFRIQPKSLTEMYMDSEKLTEM